MTEAGNLKDAIRDALGRVDGPDGPIDLVGKGRIRRLEATRDGRVRFAVALRPGEPARVAEDARRAASSVEGVESVEVALEPARSGETWSSPEPPPESSPPEPPSEPSPSPSPGSPSESGPVESSGRSLPVVDGSPDGGEGRGDRDRRVAAREPDEAPALEGVDRVLAVSSGKGGVGKSTVATNLAAAWAADGHSVGLLDGDVYGPDVPSMLGAAERPEMDEGEIVPLEAHGVRLMSLGLLLDDDTPAIVRGPMLQKIVRQFLRQVEWGDLDYLVVDLPPGTGDAQLSLTQLVRLDGGVFVTTPEDVAVDGVLRGVRMFERLEVPVLGVVENMSGFVCPDCGSRHEIFGSGGGERLADSMDLPFLGTVPLGARVREESGRGVPTVLGRPESGGAEAFRSIASRVLRALEGLEDPAQRSR